MDPTKQPGLSIAQIFLNHAEFRHRGDVLELPKDTKVSQQKVNIGVRVLRNLTSPAVALLVEVRNDAEEQAIYEFRVEMMAIVTPMAGAENLSPSEYVRFNGIATLYPFIREAVANLTMRGRFGPVWLNPFNVTVIDDPLVERPAGATPRAPTEETLQAEVRSERARLTPNKEERMTRSGSAKAKNVPVVPAPNAPGKFVAKVAGSARPLSRPATQARTIEKAIPVAKKNKSGVVIHRRDGTIRDSDSYGNESRKKDKKH